MIEYCAGIVKLYNVETSNNKKGSWVNEEDYLRVVEEKELYKENLTRVQNHLQIKVQECKEKDVEIINMKINYRNSYKEFEKELEIRDEKIERENENYLRMNKKLNECYEIIKEKDHEIKRKSKTIDNLMKQLIKLEEKEEQLYTLKYIYEAEGVVKEYEQNGMLKEDAEELIGMDSDNWNHWSLTKEERPDKDKIIEGLLIRCESNEELIKELEEKIENLEIENRQLLNDHRLKIGLSDRRA
ncbi:hypothetical protein [Bacillus phage Juan]|uniref:Uncharacterized protein n=1 Tax=Bacillus phage Juan TaxID=2023949 RepID=A0A223LJB8_9CAUD|nr:hypothetical protein H3012_gp06 [Bacillus phage Juan]ASU04095.1 hypothetical protein [Bacillus phage Juan]